MEIEHSEIIVRKITKNAFKASCNTTKPFRSEVNMSGRTEQIAEQKLRLFLLGEPYKHLDNE